MTKNELTYAFKQFGIDPNNYTNNFTTVDDEILYISFSDATKTKLMDQKSQFKFDMSNEVVIQRRLNPRGNVICYPGTSDPCYNIFSFDSIISVGRKPKKEA